MGRKRYSELIATPEKVLALTSLTVEEFAELVGPFEQAFQNVRMFDRDHSTKPFTLPLACTHF